MSTRTQYPEIMVRVTEVNRKGDARAGGFCDVAVLPYGSQRALKKHLPWPLPFYWFMELWIPQDPQATGRMNDIQAWTRVVDTNSPGLRWAWQRRAEEMERALLGSCRMVSGTEGIGDF